VKKTRAETTSETDGDERRAGSQPVSSSSSAFVEYLLQVSSGHKRTRAKRRAKSQALSEEQRGTEADEHVLGHSESHRSLREGIVACLSVKREYPL
jgi:hypothetical protein